MIRVEKTERSGRLTWYSRPLPLCVWRRHDKQCWGGGSHTNDTLTLQHRSENATLVIVNCHWHCVLLCVTVYDCALYSEHCTSVFSGRLVCTSVPLHLDPVRSPTIHTSPRYYGNKRPRGINLYPMQKCVHKSTLSCVYIVDHVPQILQHFLSQIQRRENT